MRLGTSSAPGERRGPAPAALAFDESPAPAYSQSVESAQAPELAPPGFVGAAPGGPRARAKPALVSVVMPVRNGEPHLADQLAALAAQTYGEPWELVVVDNGSTDGTLEVVERFRSRLPAVVIVDASSRKGLNFARNRGAAAARGDLLAFCDADDVVAPGWLAGLAEAARGADLVQGANSAEELNSPLTRAWRPLPKGPLVRKHGFLPHVSGGNCAVWRDVVDRVPWDETFAYGSSDIEFSWRAQLAGFTLGIAPDAVLHQRFRPGLRAMVRQYYRYGKSDAQLYRRFRREGMARSSVRDAARSWRRLLSRVGDLADERRRGDWLRLAARHWGRVVGSLRWRVLFL